MLDATRLDVPQLTDCRLYRIIVWDPHTSYTTTTLGYIGETARLPLVRLIEHLYDQPWADTIAGINVDSKVYPDKASVLAAEQQAIETEQPLYNIEHNQANPRRIPPWVAQRQAAARGRTGRPAPHRRTSTNTKTRRPPRLPSWLNRWWQRHRRPIIIWASAWTALFAIVWWAGSGTWTGWDEPRNAAITATALSGLLAWWWHAQPQPRRRKRRRRR